jgi:hypothetical protein
MRVGNRHAHRNATAPLASRFREKGNREGQDANALARSASSFDKKS